MSGIAAGEQRAQREAGGVGLFLRRWAANPLQMGSIVPSSPALGRKIAALVERGPDEVVVELGAGTGAVSRALLEGGVPADRLVVVEIVPEMARHLARELPGVTVIEGDAFALAEALPAALHGRVGTAICGIPLVLLPTARQRAFVEAVEAVAPGRGFLLYTYCVTSPLPCKALGLTGRREAFTPLNFPPASVWRYRRAG
ncbi:methyltransferase domain-containing protein [Roseomonas alkaliterrae]|uniref:Phosphatidylethanolamine/phosphatidyl-N-methylethanolamine N-methyltransferase n=1 Tax=Neoroseomonas alkaliterrae TaxID=1452450 RepID=A0A840XVS8_9PROT|nr:methyltransferase domain-containing protein [Neoroseomonas alkaliterrae]MBB5691220.1 phosphatidylethanolamine/phosphatidyl-N-methylethanolamine N-methyltransferase [Neoroseomonas alkaliterrae]MBR0677172.1 methyltransferase domain-containing protein [Neoroseomonas alkaliterrae]